MVALGPLPSIIWLSFYLRQDCDPEPKYVIFINFLMGIVIALPVLIMQMGFVYLSEVFSSGIFEQGSWVFYLWSAFAEEFMKFLAVFVIVYLSPNFDEPVDGMIYMIAAGLGFAAIENVLVMFNLLGEGATVALGTLALRFVGATLLHALACAITGYFLAMAWFYREHKWNLIIVGVILATLFHAAFNLLIAYAQSTLNPMIGLVYTTFLLIIMAFLVSVLFDKMRERSDSCIMPAHKFS